MPDRAIIPLLPALSIGFIGGIISAALQLTAGAALTVAIVGGILVAVAGVSSVFGVSGDRDEKKIVGALRAGCAVMLYACMFLFILGFLREGKASSLIWLILGVVLAIVLSQLRVRDRGEMESGETAQSGDAA